MTSNTSDMLGLSWIESKIPTESTVRSSLKAELLSEVLMYGMPKLEV